MNNEEKTALMGNLNSVNYDEFIAATSEWKGVCIANSGMLGTIILPHHFEIQMVDLIDLIEEMKDPNAAVSVRAYIGVQHYGQFRGVADASEMRLFLTGVNAEGNPILREDGHSAIYDFITPCPPTC